MVRADFTPTAEEERAPRGESTDRQLQCGRYTQPAGTILRSPPRVLMMQASDHGHLDDSTLVGALHRSRLRCVLLQGEVSPATVVVGEVVSQPGDAVAFRSRPRRGRGTRGAGSQCNAFWLVGALGIVAVGSVGAWIISIIGAVVLLAILKASNIDK